MRRAAVNVLFFALAATGLLSGCQTAIPSDPSKVGREGWILMAPDKDEAMRLGRGNAQRMIFKQHDAPNTFLIQVRPPDLYIEPCPLATKYDQGSGLKVLTYRQNYFYRIQEGKTLDDVMAWYRNYFHFGQAGPAAAAGAPVSTGWKLKDKKEAILTFDRGAENIAVSYLTDTTFCVESKPTATWVAVYPDADETGRKEEGDADVRTYKLHEGKKFSDAVTWYCQQYGL